MEREVLNVPLNVSSDFLWFILFIAFVIFGVLSWILVHHWNYYGIKNNKRIFAKSLYFIGGIVLIVFAVLLIGAYSIL